MSSYAVTFYAPECPFTSACLTGLLSYYEGSKTINAEYINLAIAYVISQEFGKDVDARNLSNKDILQLMWRISIDPETVEVKFDKLIIPNIQRNETCKRILLEIEESDHINWERNSFLNQLKRDSNASLLLIDESEISKRENIFQLAHIQFLFLRTFDSASRTAKNIYLEKKTVQEVVFECVEVINTTLPIHTTSRIS